MFDGLWLDLSRAARRLRTELTFVVFSALSAAVGVAVVTTGYSIAKHALWATSGVEQSKELAVVVHPSLASRPARMSSADLTYLTSNSRSFLTVAAAVPMYAPIKWVDDREIVPLSAVSDNYFSTLRVRAARGRLIEESDHSTPIAVISYRVWRSRFHGADTTVGSRVTIFDTTFEIVGVTPAAFLDPEDVGNGAQAVRVWIPRSTLNGSSDYKLGTSANIVTAVIRLNTSATWSSARIETQLRSDQLDSIAGGTDGVRPTDRKRFDIVSLDNMRASNNSAAKVGWAVLLLTAIVFAVAVTNVGCLVLARGVARWKEYAVRRALGASNWRLMREQLVEGLVVTLIAAALSVVLLIGLSGAFGADLPFAVGRSLRLRPDLDVSLMAFAGLAMAVALIVSSIEPGLRLASARNLRGEIEQSIIGAAPGTNRRQRILLRWQAAGATAFFVIASACAQHLLDVSRHDSGVGLAQLAVGIADLAALRWNAERMTEELQRIEREAKLDPTLMGLSASSGFPFGINSTDRALVSRDGSGGAAAAPAVQCNLIGVSGDFFRVAGIRLSAGSDSRFREKADPGRVPVVISLNGARALFGADDAIGRPLEIKTSFRKGPGLIEGVVSAVADNTDTQHYMLQDGVTVYAPLGIVSSDIILVEGRSSRAALGVAALRRLARASPDGFAFESVSTAEDLLTGTTAMVKTLAFAALFLGCITLFLGMVGLYALESYVVTAKTREIGIRLSVGATPRTIYSLILLQGYRPVAEGLCIGVSIGWVTRAMVRVLWITPIPLFDPWMFIGAPIVLTAAAFIACMVPARRASHVAPSVALRHL